MQRCMKACKLPSTREAPGTVGGATVKEPFYHLVNGRERG